MLVYVSVVDMSTVMAFTMVVKKYKINHFPMNCSTTIIRSASMCLYPLKYCHLELDQEFSVFNARSGVTYGLGCQKKGLGFQCDPFNYVNESTMSGFVGAYRDELSALPFLNRSVDDIQQWQLDVESPGVGKMP